jgi:uncharacterized protein (TIGR02271 family)
MQSREPRSPTGRTGAVPTGAGETTDAVAFEGEPITPQQTRPPTDRPARRSVADATARAQGIELTPDEADRELTPDEADRVIELREERLVARKAVREVGEVVVRTQVDEVPGQLEAEALRDEVEIDHLPVGEAVSERVRPWEEDGALIVPVYEEQLVLVKRLVMREKIRIRRVQTTERRMFQDTLRRERLVVEDGGSAMVHERYPSVERRGAPDPSAPLLSREELRRAEGESGGLLGQLRKVLE